MIDIQPPPPHHPAMKLSRPATALLLSLAAVLAHAAPPDAPRVAALDDAVAPFLKSGEVPGVVTLVASKDNLLHLSAAGEADIDTHAPMKPDTIVWIASMSKPITAAAVMMMQDQGKLSVDDPVSKYIPEFKGLKTADGKTPVVTIKHMLSHTSGMSDVSPAEAKACKTLAALVPVVAAKPLRFEPGSKWSYCQSSINMAARVVEIVSGQPFDEFVQKRLFAPLGMNDTTFYLSEAQLPRLATSYKKSKDGKLEKAENFILLGLPPTSRDRYPAANGGLFSTAPDYARFLQMVANGGTLDGKTYLKPETVKQMTTICTGDLKTGFTPGNGWGIGWCVVREPQGVTAMLSPGTHGHGGAYGTQAWIDPAKGRIFILMIQRAGLPNADASDIRKAFQQAATDSIK